MEIFNIFFQLQVMETIQNHSIFTFFVFYFVSRRHFTSRNKVGCLVLAHHEQILNPILDKDSIYRGSNVMSCANIPLPHLGSVFFCVNFRQHAFIFKTSLMMLSVILKNDASICDPTKTFFKSKVICLFVAPLIKL
jgi:hypothetical protein